MFNFIALGAFLAITIIGGLSSRNEKETKEVYNQYSLYEKNGKIEYRYPSNYDESLPMDKVIEGLPNYNWGYRTNNPSQAEIDFIWYGRYLKSGFPKAFNVFYQIPDGPYRKEIEGVLVSYNRTSDLLSTTATAVWRASRGIPQRRITYMEFKNCFDGRIKEFEFRFDVLIKKVQSRSPMEVKELVKLRDFYSSQLVDMFHEFDKCKNGLVNQ